MAMRGRVREWRDDEGWGVLDTDETPGGCWAHFSAVLVAGLWTLRAGQDVLVEVERAEQDGYDFRAVAVWPADREPVPHEPDIHPSPAYRSSLRLSFDDPEHTG